MKIGTDEVKHLVLRALKKHGAVLKGVKYGEFADDLTEQIFELIGADMSKRDWDMYHNFPTELEPIVKKLQRGLGLNMMRDENAQDVYRWLAEQGDEKISAFIRWATNEENVKYVGKYRTSPGLIKTNWKQVFKVTEQPIKRNEDGSLNV